MLSLNPMPTHADATTARVGGPPFDTTRLGSERASRRPAARRAPLGWVAVALVALFLLPTSSVSAADQYRTALADAFTQRALALLQSVDVQDRDRLEAATVLLALSTELDPDDAERHRLRSELARTTGDAETLGESLGRYVRLRPRDDVAMMELLLARLGDTQTLDGRLAAIERVLKVGEHDGRLSRPLMSRLAWLAAEASQELGDRKRYVRWIKESARLDPANALPAETTFALVAELDAGPKALGAAAKNWVEAAPTNARARLALAEVLASQAAYLDAAQQFGNAARFASSPLPWSAYHDWVLSVAAAGDRVVAMDLIDSLVAVAEAGALATPSEGELPVEIELLRLILLDLPPALRPLSTLDPDPAAEESFRRIDGQLRSRINGDNASAVNAKLDLAWVTALYGPDVDEVESLVADAAADDPRRRRALGWALLRQDRADDATELLASVPDDPVAKLGLLALAEKGSPSHASLQRALVRDHATSPAALIAARLYQRDNRPVEPTAEGVALLDLMQRTDSKVWRMDLIRDPWIELQARVRPITVDLYQSVTLELSIRNASPLPLAVGPEQAVRLTALLNTGLFAGGQALGALPTQVVDGNRRLTLRPGERITVPFRLDWHGLGRLALQDPTRTFAFALSATLDPRVRDDGAMTTGPLGVTDTVRGLQQRGVAFDDTSATGWLTELGRVGSTEQAESVALLVQALVRQAGGVDTRAAAADALNALAAEGDPASLAWAVYHLDAEQPQLQRLLDTARRSENELVRVAHLIARVDRADHPALDAAARTSLPRLQRFAEAWRGVVEQGFDRLDVSFEPAGSPSTVVPVEP